MGRCWVGKRARKIKKEEERGREIRLPVGRKKPSGGDAHPKAKAVEGGDGKGNGRKNFYF